MSMFLPMLVRAAGMGAARAAGGAVAKEAEGAALKSAVSSASRTATFHQGKNQDSAPAAPSTANIMSTLGPNV